MTDESSIFDAEPENLDRLFSQILGAPQEQEDSGPAATVEGPIEQPGSRIGRYKLLSILGEGGMGMVYLAEQEGQIRRRVALKIIKPGMDSKRVVARFEAERQALALLDHPGVAQVYDAGTTEQGRPYFVMEHVRGVPITDYCDRHRLNIEDRLELFKQVCLATHHAHQKGIIHRDIKPSNVLVSAENDRPAPKIIDFGVAKAISQPLTERTLFTEDSHLLGTPEYMSPEQADMVREDIDIRSDIYSLGVLLYVLLTGVLPFDSDTLRESGIESIRKTIRETDPKTPSTRLIKLGDEARKLAENRRTEIHYLAKCLKKELEWIPMKAMRKERSERYRSASELADDIGNYLDGAPLMAGPPTTLYRLKKFARRNAVLSAAVLVAGVTLVLGLTATTALYLRAEEALDKEARASANAQEATRHAEKTALEATQAAEREATARAEAEQATAEAQMIIEFLRQDVLLGAPRSIKGRDATILEVVDIASDRIEKHFRDQPLIEADIRGSLGWTCWHLGDFKASAMHRERQHEIRREYFAEAENLPIWPSVSHFHAGNYEEAEKLQEAIREVRIRKGHVEIWPHGNLANTYARQGRYHEAEKLFLEAFEAWGWNPNQPETSYGWLLARVWREQGRYEEAEKLFVNALNALRAELGAKADTNMRSRIRCMSALARLYVIQGRYDEAEALFNEGIALGDNQFPGKDHPFTMRHVNGLGVLRTKQGRFEEAEALFKRALEGRKAKLGENHLYTMETINDLGLLRREQGHYKEAETLITEALEKRTAKLGPDHPHTLQSMHELAVLHIRQDQHQRAADLLAKAAEGRLVKLGDKHPHTQESLSLLIDLYKTLNQPKEAEKWRAMLPAGGTTNRQSQNASGR